MINFQYIVILSGSEESMFAYGSLGRHYVPTQDDICGIATLRYVSSFAMTLLHQGFGRTQHGGSPRSRG
ncbi:hypothetical protein COY15_02405 [Candidatus Roizmanbacteria bacterium CG_4_10_14_0_2_um_filter_39_12]|nr:MAG: hypothetical protein COY15_02405 [Candidatus Roizmanbacteria bacterium CG_4_10_14_0_2_um_filter_39_12]